MIPRSRSQSKSQIIFTMQKSKSKSNFWNFWNWFLEVKYHCMWNI